MTENDIQKIQALDIAVKFYYQKEANSEPYKYEMVKKNGCCIFLSDNRCTIYEDRPIICRFYPFSLFEADSYTFDVDGACRGIGEGEVVDERYFNNLVEDAKDSC